MDSINKLPNRRPKVYQPVASAQVTSSATYKVSALITMDELNVDQAPQDINKDEFLLERRSGKFLVGPRRRKPTLRHCLTCLCYYLAKMFSLLTPVLCFTLLAGATLACESIEQLENKFCQSTYVFRGRPTSGSSGLSFDRSGRQMQHGRITFSVDEYYRILHSDGAHTVEVSRTYSDDDPCDSAFLPQTDGTSYVVFATGTDGNLQVPACGHVIPFECAPDNLESISC
ncbi:hypothetical protein Btru_040208 [Bulinus truncatus]|nr:hypothetical protein Btru_040208 [Bulinus truncatus]